MAQKHVNAVVVGAGAGGGIVAKELSAAGLGVVLLERGEWVTPYDNRKDDLRSQRLPALGVPFGPDGKRHPRVFVDDQGKETEVDPTEWAYGNNAACVGGGTACYGAMAWRFMEQDFRMRSTYGAVAGSTLEDWPIGYADLEPYYEKAEWEIGVCGNETNNVFSAPRRRPFPMPPLSPNREYGVLDSAARRLGWHPFDVPMLRNSVPFNGRGRCVRCRWCVGFGCEVNAKNGTQNTVIPQALATGNCDLRTGCMTSQILTDSQGRATGVAYYDANDRLQEQPADLVVISCGAIESARLLLNSRNHAFPQGLGNRYDWVGRNLMDHVYHEAWGLFDAETYDDLGPGASIAVCDFNHGNKGFAGGGLLANEFIRLPIDFAQSGAPWTSPHWGRAHKDYMRKWHKRSIVLKGPVQPMPVFAARAQLHPHKRDYWGIPVVCLSGFTHSNDLAAAQFLSSRSELWLKEAGAVTTWTNVPGPGFGVGPHQAGTCRMGSDPRTSVVDSHCRIHDMDNLYVVDASVHVTNGGFNPALTVMAVAYHASMHILKSSRTWKPA